MSQESNSGSCKLGNIFCMHLGCRIRADQSSSPQAIFQALQILQSAVHQMKQLGLSPIPVRSTLPSPPNRGPLRPITAVAGFIWLEPMEPRVVPEDGDILSVKPRVPEVRNPSILTGRPYSRNCWTTRPSAQSEVSDNSSLIATRRTFLRESLFVYTFADYWR